MNVSPYYRAEYYDLPEHLLSSLIRYAEHGVPTGGALRSLLESDLFAFVRRADFRTLAKTKTLCEFVYNELPRECWGSPEKVAAWIKAKAEERREVTA